ncbi:MAG: dTDP-4-dehydrorhamnose reductase [Anaerolineae bacterium]|nr:dTDP-4-dehydrorhamnose reductase [Anaerolineae bacterium]
MKLLITGAAGRLGSKLVELLRSQGHSVTGADIVGEGVTRIDITNFASTRALVADLKPDIVLHPAAWTDVDGCAREPEKAIQINGLGAQNVALAAAAVGAPILHVSSNEVFDGQRAQPYREYDLTNPINPYAYSKWYGERAVQSVNPQHYIVRTAWLFAHGGKNFIQAILNAAAAGKPLRVVSDEVANPTYNDDLAEAITRLISTGRFGVYHLINEGACSRYDFARYILSKSGFAETPVQKITSTEWPRPSLPPAYSSLSNLAARQIGITLRPWQEAVDAFLAKEGRLV